MQRITTNNDFCLLKLLEVWSQYGMGWFHAGANVCSHGQFSAISPQTIRMAEYELGDWCQVTTPPALFTVYHSIVSHPRAHQTKQTKNADSLDAATATHSHWRFCGITRWFINGFQLLRRIFIFTTQLFVTDCAFQWIDISRRTE